MTGRLVDPPRRIGLHKTRLLLQYENYPPFFVYRD